MSDLTAPEQFRSEPSAERQLPDSTGRSDLQRTSPSFRKRLLGRDIPIWSVVAFLLLSFAQVAFHFYRFSMKPVPASGEKYFPAEFGYQNGDVPTWVLTGAMLPQNAPSVRAMRPLYPGVITVAGALGLIEIPPEMKQAPPGGVPALRGAFDYWRGVRLLQATNVVLFVLSLWFFFSLARHFGLSSLSAALASYAAGAGFGFGFWVSQAVPEVFGYFTSVAALAVMTLAAEWDLKNVSHAAASASSMDRKRSLRSPDVRHQAFVWGSVGLLFGVLLLGKELYYLPIFGALFLLTTRRWAGFAAFCVLILLPTAGWNYYMAKIVGAFDPKKYLQEYRFLVWLWQDLGPLSWGDRIRALLDNLARQVICLFQAFAFAPVFAALAGFVRRVPSPWVRPLSGAFFFSIYILFLASDFVRPRLMFMTWPIVYYFAWLGFLYCGEMIARVLKQTGKDKRRTILSFEFTALAALIWLGAQQQFRWYYYG